MLSLISSLLAITTILVTWWADKKKMDGAVAQSVLEGIDIASKAIRDANAARANAHNSSMSDDKYNRDNKGGM
jgi:hypothetical protein